MPMEDYSAQVKARLNGAIDKTLYEVAEMLYAGIYPLIPTDSTALKTSLDYKITPAEQTVVIGVNATSAEGAPYPIYVEFGTGIYAENGQGRKGGWSYKDEKTGKRIWTMGSRSQSYMRKGYKNVKKNCETIVKNNFANIK